VLQTDTYEQVARDAVAAVSPVLQHAWKEAKAIHHKGPVDLVTDTDRHVEALLVERISTAFPDHLIVAEEASEAAVHGPPSAEQLVWYIDPLDGTTNFAHGYPHFAVSVALARGTDPLLGVVHDPLRDETFVAVRGRGATMNGISIAVSATAQLGNALVGTGFPYDRREHVDFYLGFVKDVIVAAQGVRRNGAAALDLCYVACGRLEGFWEWKLHPWDIAAGALIVSEAGGAVSDFTGGRLDLHGDQVLATNGLIHPALARLLSVRLRHRGA
jgi:myo-inositol-1(or 4)-monophosphatase